MCKRPPLTIYVDQQIRYCRICGRGSSPQSRLRDEKRSEHLMRKSRFSKTTSETAVPFLLCSLSVYFLSLSSFRERRKRENRQKNTPASDIKKKPLPRGEVSRLHRDGEGVNDSGKVHLTRTPLFLWQLKAQRKSLAKRNAAQGVSPLRRRGGVRRLHSRKLLKKLDQNFHTNNC